MHSCTYHKSLTNNSDIKDIETELDFDNEINHKARSLSPSSFSSQGSYSKPGLFGQSQGSWNYQSGTLVILKLMTVIVYNVHTSFIHVTNKS